MRCLNQLRSGSLARNASVTWFSASTQILDVGVGADVVLEPAIRVRDRHAELGFDDIDRLGWG